jgi:hypothetical protein
VTSLVRIFCLDCGKVASTVRDDGAGGATFTANAARPRGAAGYGKIRVVLMDALLPVDLPVELEATNVTAQFVNCYHIGCGFRGAVPHRDLLAAIARARRRGKVTKLTAEPLADWLRAMDLGYGSGLSTTEAKDKPAGDPPRCPQPHRLTLLTSKPRRPTQVAPRARSADDEGAGPPLPVRNRVDPDSGFSQPTL